MRALRQPAAVDRPGAEYILAVLGATPRIDGERQRGAQGDLRTTDAEAATLSGFQNVEAHAGRVRRGGDLLVLGPSFPCDRTCDGDQ